MTIETIRNKVVLLISSYFCHSELRQRRVDGKRVERDCVGACVTYYYLLLAVNLGGVELIANYKKPKSHKWQLEISCYRRLT